MIFGGDFSRQGAGVLAVLFLSAPAVALRTWTGILLRLTGQLKELVGMNVAFVMTTCGLAGLGADWGLVWVGAAWLLGNLLSGGVAVWALLRGGRLSARVTVPE